MTWATRRQILYLSILALLFIGVGYWVGKPYFSAEPTCFDGRRNGDERGVDCGGSCARACVFDVDQLSVLWTRIFKVVDGRYNAVAYLENQNKDTAAINVRYRFRFADENNVYIGSREGVTSIPPAGRFAIFEPAVGLGHSVPVYASFEFAESPVWVNVEPEKLNSLRFSFSDIQLIDSDTRPRLSATFRNNSLYTVPDVNLVAILYGADGNAINASNTYIEFVRPEESRVINYTWQEPIVGEVVVREIIPMYNIFQAELR